MALELVLTEKRWLMRRCMDVLGFTGLILVGVFSAGCIVFPYTTQIASSVDGMVVNVQTGAPVKDASLRYYMGGHEQYYSKAASDKKGLFHAKEIHQWHWLLFLGSPGMYPYPVKYLTWESPYCFDVEADGFEPQTIQLENLPSQKLIIHMTPAP